MEALKFTDSHNMVPYLEKSMENANFNEIVDFLNANPIRYAITVSPNIYVSYIEQFWSTAKTKTINNETQIRAKVEGKTIVITESSVRRDLYFDDEDVFNDEYYTPSHTKKVFANMRRKGKDFSRVVALLFPSMLASQAVEGEGSRQPTEPQHTPTTASPSHVEPIPTVASSSQPQKTHKHRKTKRKATKISQSSGPTTFVADETVHEEREDIMERVATTASSLEVERQDIILGDRPAKTMFESLSKQSNDPPLLRVNTLGIKKLEKKKKSRTPQPKRRVYKPRVESSEENLGDQEDASKQGRINEIDQDEGISWFQEDAENQGSAPITTAGVSVRTAEPSTPPTTTTTVIEDEDLTIAQALMKMRSVKSKEKSKEKGVSSKTATRLTRGVIMKEASETASRPIVPPQQQLDPKDKGKGIIQEHEKPVKVKGKDQIEYDANVAQRLQVELDEEARLERESEKEASNAALDEEWDSIEIRIDVDA
ncbi:hypothetical protein Tco_0344401 [Tanacetum coccineum]